MTWRSNIVQFSVNSVAETGQLHPLNHSTYNRESVLRLKLVFWSVGGRREDPKRLDCPGQLSCTSKLKCVEKKNTYIFFCGYNICIYIYICYTHKFLWRWQGHLSFYVSPRQTYHLKASPVIFKSRILLYYIHLLYTCICIYIPWGHGGWWVGC